MDSDISYYRSKPRLNYVKTYYCNGPQVSNYGDEPHYGSDKHSHFLYERLLGDHFPTICHRIYISSDNQRKLTLYLRDIPYRNTIKIWYISQLGHHFGHSYYAACWVGSSIER